MDPQFVRENLLRRYRQYGNTYREAGKEFLRELGDFGRAPEAKAIVNEQVQRLQDDAAEQMVLTRPRGVHDPYYDRIEDEAREAHWYPGRQSGDTHWPGLKANLLQGLGEENVLTIDRESRTIVAHLANPNVRRLRKKGLVIGHVQSGKTANYTAVMATAADAGYRLFIVLAGMHNSLRQQTQRRLERQLMNGLWKPLTSPREDFGVVFRDEALLRARELRVIAVVKKNSSRLRKVLRWLRSIPVEIREACPALLLDDEADQATPNTAAARQEVSAINSLIRQIRLELPTGTYLGYTATPFANVFMDPDDDQELYPSDFIISLTRPPAYFGAERLFGREPLDEDDEGDDGLPMVRDINDDEAVTLRPPSPAGKRAAWVAPLPDSLCHAVCWFLLGTAIRWARGQRDDHSSMLVHTSHYIDAHFAQQARIDELLADIRAELSAGNYDRLQTVWEQETRLVPAETLGLEPVAWNDIASRLEEVAEAAGTVVDNAASEERLEYGDDEDEVDKENSEPATVIAVGGNTLSRGLTLEGLIVSYFVRFSDTYDTLLQMGRWFGYRPGYEDIPRIWMTRQLQEDFGFLATVEHELRSDITRYEREGITPREMGVKIRTHPGRLAITARSKMFHVRPAQVGYGGTRRQTFILHELDEDILTNNICAAQDLVAGCREAGVVAQPRGARWLHLGVPPVVVRAFLDAYSFHPDHPDLRSDLIGQWIERRQNAGRESTWNVVIMGSTKHTHRLPQGGTVQLEPIELGLATRVQTFNRAPLSKWPAGKANIKSLMSTDDRLADLDVPEERRSELQREHDYDALRQDLEPDRGLLLVYPVSRSSVPIRLTKTGDPVRRDMEAPRDLIGVGLVFPREPVADQGTYLSVEPDWQPDTPIEELEFPEDVEGDASVSGEDVSHAGRGQG